MPCSFLFQALEISLTKSYLVIKTINLSLFISTAILIYSLTSRVFTLTKTSENTGRTALIITLLFVCSPYQTEAVNWFSSQAYLLSTFFAILGLHFLLKNSKRKNTGFYYYFLFLFLALLNKEISLILPIIAFLLRFLQTKDERVKFQHFVLGNILVLLVYFILRFIYLDALVGGYGTEAHLNTAPAVLSYGVIAYTAKFFFFYRYLPQ